MVTQALMGKRESVVEKKKITLSFVKLRPVLKLRAVLKRKYAFYLF